MKKAIIGIFLGGLFGIQSLYAQNLKINEVMTSNTNTIQDEDGDTPDWIEIYNYGATPINLEGYGLSDSSVPESFWIFPAFVLNAGDYLVVYASDKDRADLPIFQETIIDKGDDWKYIVPTSEPSASWRSLGFDDASWLSGSSSIGYGDGDDATIVNNVISVYMRKEFDVQNVAEISGALLHMDYDDGFIAYLNGQEIARSGLTDPIPPYNATAPNHEAVIYNGGIPESFNIENIGNLLVEGTNVLAVQVHNTSTSSSDFTSIPFLTFKSDTPRSNRRSNYLNYTEGSFHTNFKLSSSGDSVFLRLPSLAILDTIVTGSLPANVSIGRLETDGLFYFSASTPGSANTTTAFTSISSEVAFSIDEGSYSEAVQVEITSENASDIIYYSLDGSKPDESDLVYQNPISISNSSVLRARVLSDEGLPGPVKTASYLINLNHEITVVSLAVDPYEFFDPQNGMYMKGPGASNDYPYFGANFWQDWEREVHVTLIEKDDEVGFSANAGAKIFGNYSRGNDQKSLSLFFRKAYGDGPLDYKLFVEKDLKDYSSIVLRNSGNDWNNTMLRDGFLTSLFHKDVDTQAYKPAVIYMNGDYWGILNIREKVNEHFLANNHDLDSDSIEIVGANGTPVEPIYGNEEHYTQLYYYIDGLGTVSEENLNEIGNQMDLQNFIYYQTGNIYINNKDWPGNNIKFWRSTAAGGKWRWIAYDTDFGFGTWGGEDYNQNTLSFALDANGPGWPNPPWSTMMLRKLMTNTAFKNQFINSFCDQLNSIWLSDVVIANLEDKQTDISGEIQAHIQRWGGDYNYWLNQIQVMRNFAIQRPAKLRNYIKTQFNLSGQYELTVKVSNSQQGSIRVNTLTPTQLPWSGDYFNNIPIEVEAIPNAGHRFVRWEGTVTSTESLLTQAFTSDTQLKAIFEETDDDFNSVVINEIFYKSSDEFDAKDWVELYNKGDKNLDLSGWTLKDDDDDHAFVFPENTTIDSKGFLVVCQDQDEVKGKYSSLINTVGDMDFGLSASGDCVRLYNDQDQLIEQVCYLGEAPWPATPNGLGYSLALMNPSFDNTQEQFWFANAENGNPGELNERGFVTALEDDIAKNELHIYPNPLKGKTTLSYRLDKPGAVKIDLYNVQGQRIQYIYNGTAANGQLEVAWSATGIRAGVYLIKLETADETVVKRIIVE